MSFLESSIQYEWVPFTLNGAHITFIQHKSSRLEQTKCSQWGAAIYMWKGQLDIGPKSGKTGVLIGETKNIRQRIKQYISGTQPRGNKLWRESFLELGDIFLYTLRLVSFRIAFEDGSKEITPDNALASNNMRLILEQLLISREIIQGDPGLWVVNSRK